MTMTINFIDQVLNIAIAALVYGSEIWFTYAFSLYVATHKLESSKQPAQKKTQTLLPAKAPDLSTNLSQREAPRQAIEPKVTASPATTVKVPSNTPVHSGIQQITCEPVNWKKWKVNDLRKASIACVCGVKATPIGSRRKLTKADLIAQYEQNLKRMTKLPPARTRKQAQTA